MVPTAWLATSTSTPARVSLPLTCSGNCSRAPSNTHSITSSTKLGLSGFDARFNNDATGAAAYPPAMLLKVVLFAYSQGIVSSRSIEAACRDHVTFIALSGDTQPHFTTIAGFVSSLADDIARVFTQILYLCDRQGLIGREMFAIDGEESMGSVQTTFIRPRPTRSLGGRFFMKTFQTNFGLPSLADRQGQFPVMSMRRLMRMVNRPQFTRHP